MEFRDRFAPAAERRGRRVAGLLPSAARQSRDALSRRRRAALGGFLPARRRAAAAAASRFRRSRVTQALRLAAAGRDDVDHDGGGAHARRPPKDKALGPRIVPIVADEARTFGMAWLFRQIGIYAPEGQLYEPEDAGSLLSYREARDGQLLEEGITEAGAVSSWTAAATAYSVHGLHDAAVLYLLFDVRLSAGRRPDLGGGRPAGARLPLRRHGGAHDAGGGGVAASGRLEPCDGGAGPELPRLRSGFRLRTRRHHRPRDATHDRGPGRRVLLRHRDERELPAALGARRGRGRHRRGPLSARRGRRRVGGARAAGRLGHDPARGDRRGGAAGRGLGRRERRVQRDEFCRTRARGGRNRAREPAASRRARRASAMLRGCCRARADRRRERLRPRLAATHRRSMSRRASWRWEPTASAAATRAPRCANSSRSTAAISRWRRFMRWSKRGRSRARPVEAVQALRRRPGGAVRRWVT